MTDSYNDIGALLARGRKDSRLSLQQASDLLHIRARYLQALEEGRFGDLPGKAYIKGYLLAYASFLDLDKDEILRRFERLEAELPQRGLYLPESLSREKAPTGAAIWGGLGVALVLYILWALIFKPSAPEVPIVDAVPIKPAPAITVYHGLPLKDACFRPAKALYPPCYNDVRAEVFIWLPLPHKVVSFDLY